MSFMKSERGVHNRLEFYGGGGVITPKALNHKPGDSVTLSVVIEGDYYKGSLCTE